MKALNLKIAPLFLFLTVIASASQLLPDQKSHSDYNYELTGKPDKIKSNAQGYLPEYGANSPQLEKNPATHTTKHYEGHVQGVPVDSDVKIENSQILPQGHVSGEGLKESQYKEYSSQEIWENNRRQKTTGYLFAYYLDPNNGIQDDRGLFNNIFKKPEATYYGPFMLSGTYYFSRSSYNMFDLGVGLRVGAWYRKGYASYEGESQTSEEYLQLWGVPVTPYFLLEMRPSSLFKFSFLAGPSALALFQGRSDTTSEDNDDQSQRRQIGYGFLVDGSFGISLSALFKKWGNKMFSNYQTNNFYLSFRAGYYSYSQFPDKFTAQGPTFGIGIDFEVF